MARKHTASGLVFLLVKTANLKGTESQHGVHKILRKQSNLIGAITSKTPSKLKRRQNHIERETEPLFGSIRGNTTMPNAPAVGACLMAMRPGCSKSNTVSAQRVNAI